MSHKETVNKVLDQLLNTIEEQNETIRKLKEQNKYITEIMNLSNEMKITIFPFFYVLNFLKKLNKKLKI